MLINTECDSAVSPDAVIAACLSATVLKAVADPLNTKLTDNCMRCNSADGTGSSAGMVRTQSRVTYKFKSEVSSVTCISYLINAKHLFLLSMFIRSHF